MSATKEQIGQEQQESWEQIMFKAKLNLFGIEYLTEINKKIEEVGACMCCADEYSYLECQAYQNGLRDAVKLFKEIKEKQ